MPDPTAPAGADDECTCAVPLLPADFDPEPDCPIHGRPPVTAADPRAALSAELVELFQNHDPSRSLADEVITLLATLGLLNSPAIQDAELERLRAAKRHLSERISIGQEGWNELHREVERLRAELANRCTCGETACESELCDCDATPCPANHRGEHAEAELRRLCSCDLNSETTQGPDETCVIHGSEQYRHNVVAVEQRRAEKAEAQRDALKAAIAETMKERQRHVKEFHPTRLVAPSCAGCRIGMTLSREMPARPDAPEELDLLFRVTKAESAVERLEALCERALADDGTRFEDPMPLPGWVTLIQNALRPPVALAIPDTAPETPSAWSCPRCGSDRWVAASLTGPVEFGGRAIKQCAPCGYYSSDPVRAPEGRGDAEEAMGRE